MSGALKQHQRHTRRTTQATNAYVKRISISGSPCFKHAVHTNVQAPRVEDARYGAADWSLSRGENDLGLGICGTSIMHLSKPAAEGGMGPGVTLVTAVKRGRGKGNE
jgi:hypothetical protein